MFPPVVFAPILLAAGWLALARPQALLGFLLLVSSAVDAQMPLGAFDAHPSGIILLVTVLTTGFRALTGAIAWRFTRLDGLTLALAGWVLVTAALTEGRGTTGRVLALGMFLSAFVTARLLVRDRPSLERYGSNLSLAGLIAALVAVILLPGSHHMGRSSGAFGNPNSLGMFVGLSVPMQVARMLVPRPGGSRIPGLLMVLATLGGLWVSGSRGGLVGALAGAFYVATRNLGRSLGLAFLVTLGFATATLYQHSPHGFSRIPHAISVAPRVFETSKVWLAVNGFMEAEFTEAPWVEPDLLADFPQTMGARMMIWYQAVTAGLANPWTGIGPGRSWFTGVPFDSKTFSVGFNIYLSSFVETGFPGLLLHVAWLATILVSLLGIRRRLGPVPEEVGLRGAILAVMLHGLVEDTYFGIHVNWAIGLCFGAAAGLVDPLPGSSRTPQTIAGAPA